MVVDMGRMSLWVLNGGGFPGARADRLEAQLDHDRSDRGLRHRDAIVVEQAGQLATASHPTSGLILIGHRSGQLFMALGTRARTGRAAPPVKRRPRDL